MLLQWSIGTVLLQRSIGTVLLYSMEYWYSITTVTVGLVLPQWNIGTLYHNGGSNLL